MDALTLRSFDDLDTLICPRCESKFVEPRVLPCYHTFCRECIAPWFYMKYPGDIIACPIPPCQLKFSYQVGGISRLPKNDFLEKLLEARGMLNAITSQVACDICPRLENNIRVAAAAPVASKFCLECQVLPTTPLLTLP